MSIHWHSYSSVGQAAEACARHIFLRVEEALAGQGQATLAISGGSTPKLLLEQMAKTRFNWQKVHLFWVDERCVPPTNPESNYLLAEETFIKPARFPHRNVHRIYGELRPDVAAENYSQEIAEFFRLRDDEMPHFDVIHLGMGSDAHIASLFPGQPLIEDRDGIASAVYVEQKDKWRISLLPGVLLAARHIVVLLGGEDKAEAVRSVFDAPYEPLKYPAQIVSHHCRHVTWFLDQAASAAATL
jgi:6-phosphogluconolactonase